MRLVSKEQEELVVNNLRLVPYLVNKFGVPPGQFDDFVSIGQIGLIKAAITFDESKNVRFATYASRCINNEILMCFRKEKVSVNEISMNTVIHEDGKGDLTLEDVIPSNEKDFTEEIADSEEFVSCLNIVLNLLKLKEMAVVLYRMAGLKQYAIAESLGISQSYISRIERTIKVKVKRYFEEGEQYNKIFLVRRVEEGYQISFAWKDMNQLNRILTKTKEKLKSEGFSPEVKVKISDGQIMLNIWGLPEEFYFIAEVILRVKELKALF